MSPVKILPINKVASAWRAISKTHLPEGRRDPRKPLGSHRPDLDKRLSCMLRHYGLQDPPPWSEKEVLLCFVMVAVAQAKLDAFNQCMADLLVIALFFCLRSCEYTKTNSHRRTTQFRFQYMQFHDSNGVILPDADADVLLAALEITMLLDNQNNCVHGESSTMEATGLLHGDPVPACDRRYLHIRNNNAPHRHSNLCLLCFGRRRPKICDGVKYCGAPVGHIKTDWLPAARIFPHEIGSHYLRSGGATTLHQAHISDSTIKIIWRWKSDTFLIYLQGQVDKFTKIVSKAMAAVPWFTHQVPTPGPD